MNEEAVITIILDEAFHVHRSMGPGMLENVYKTCLVYRLRCRGLQVDVECPIPVYFEKIRMDCGYRADVIVEKKIIIEIKRIEAIHDLHIAQTLTYLRFSNLRFGLILNFDVVRMKDGIRRVLNGFGDLHK